MTIRKSIKRVADKVQDNANANVWVKLLTSMTTEVGPARFESHQYGDLVLLSHTHAQSLLRRGSAVRAFDDEIERHVREKKRLAEVGTASA